jgi:mannose-1-phosphate guanylyltransferase/phosphomannomutase
MKAVVMAGGEGSRLRPLTINRPKPMVPIVNKPVMEHVLDLLRRHGILDVVVTVQYLASVIQDYFGDGSSHGMNISYSVEETPLGTAGSVKLAEELLRDDTFIVISGDALTDFDLGKIIASHKERKAKATLTLYHVPNPLEYGVVITASRTRSSTAW